MRPSSESWPLPRANGLGAAVTWGWERISSTVRSIAARRSGSRSVPESTAKTTLAVSPDAAGKALVEHVHRALRLGARGPEVIDERAAGRRRRETERDEHHRHDRQ